eukprot:s78_g32.t1
MAMSSLVKNLLTHLAHGKSGSAFLLAIRTWDDFAADRVWDVCNHKTRLKLQQLGSFLIDFFLTEPDIAIRPPEGWAAFISGANIEAILPYPCGWQGQAVAFISRLYLVVNEKSSSGFPTEAIWITRSTFGGLATTVVTVAI